MKIDELMETIKELLKKSNPQVNLSDENLDVFSSVVGATPRDLLFVCMELKKEYSINYNQIVNEVSVYSISQLSNAIHSQINKGQ